MTLEMLGHVGPPLRQRVEGVGGVIGLPIELRRDVVDGAGLEPSHGVGEDAVVLPVAGHGTFRDAVFGGHRSVGACCAGRRDAESDGRILLLYHIIYVGHHLVHVFAPPVGHGEAAARVLVVGIVLCGACGRHAAGIEVVVEDNPVHVIVLNDFAADGCDAVTGGLECGVQDGGGGSVAVCIADEHAVLLQLQVLRRAPSGRRRGPSVGIDPGMAFHAATVTFLDGELQRVPSRVFPSGAGDVAAPRLEARPIEGVGHGTHLEIDGVEVGRIEDVDVVTQLSLLFVAYRNAGAGRRGPVDAIDRGQPCAAYLALDGGILGRGCQEREAEEGG